MTARPGVVLDRDGTLIDELGYLGDPEGVRLFPGAAAAVRALNEAGLPVALVTNQSGVARGLFTEADVHRVHARIARLLAAGGARLDLVLYCPHHPDHGVPPYRIACECRKPAPGMFRVAARELDLDLGRSFSVGDSARDVRAAHAAGVAHQLLVRTGKGVAEADELGDVPVTLVDDLVSATRWILAERARAADSR